MVGRLELGRRDVAAGPVEPLGIPPSDPGGGGELNLVGGPPGTPGPDELGSKGGSYDKALAETVNGLYKAGLVRGDARVVSGRSTVPRLP